MPVRSETVSSRYSLVINSNSTMLNPTPEAIHKREQFQKGIRRIFLSRNILNFIDIIDEDCKGIPKEKLISEISCNVIEEVGGIKGHLHCHLDVAIYHRTSVNLNSPKITKYFAQVMGIAVFAQAPRIVADPTVNIRRYAEKHLKSNPPLTIHSRVIQNDEQRIFNYP